jgi:hypothetical protein
MVRWNGFWALWLCACGVGSTGDDAAVLAYGPDGSSEEYSDDNENQHASGCKRVDVLMAVDDSGSMRPKMQAISELVFPSFAAKLSEVGGGLDDFRVGVTSACAVSPILASRGDGGECALASGSPWVESTSPNLLAEFECVGDIYSTPEADGGCDGSNDDEAPTATAIAALSEPWITGANQGFLRDDALLVVVAITDEDEQPVPDRSAQELHDALVAIKGDASRIVFLGIGGSRDCDEKAAAPETAGGAEEATKLRELTEIFVREGRGVAWDLCEGNFVDGLDEAMNIIHGACTAFVPIL